MSVATINSLLPFVSIWIILLPVPCIAADSTSSTVSAAPSSDLALARASFQVKRGKLYVAMKVSYGTQLIQWIMHHSVNDIEVLQPSFLRKEISYSLSMPRQMKFLIKNAIKRKATKYSGPEAVASVNKIPSGGIPNQELISRLIKLHP